MLDLQLVPRFNVNGIDNDAVDRTRLDTLLHLEMPDALGAAPGVDDVDFHALRNRAVGALGLADVSIDALVGNEQRHDGVR